MRIAHLTWSMGVGGTQTMLTDIVNLQVNEGHEVGIFVIDTYVSETIMNKLDPRVKVFFMGRTRGKKAVIPFVKLNINLWKFKPDIIHSHAGKLIKVLLANTPIVGTVHGMTSTPKDIRKCKVIFAISKAVQDDLMRKGIRGVILNEDGIPCEAIKQKTNYDMSDIIHIVQVSRIYLDIKGQDLVVKALKQVREKMALSPSSSVKDVVVHFVGDGIDTDKLKQLVADLDLNDNVFFEGFKDRNWVYEHLCDYDLFLQASRWEGFGLTVAEACAAKLPVLVSDIDGPLEIIDGGRLGMTFKKGDADDLANQLYRFIQGKYDRSMIEPAYQRIVEKYSIERTVHQYIEGYRRVLGKI